jgi:CheY-like chemotaxis protein
VADRFILRAELRTLDEAQAPNEAIVSYGYDLTERSVFVVTDWQAPVGTAVVARLSLPRVEVVEIAATVASVTGAGAPGELAGLLLDFAAESITGDIATLLAAGAQPATASPAAYRALLVEDNRLTRDVIHYRARGFFADITVAHAESAERAWRMLATASYDVVIVDYFLPTADGASLIARLRADPRLRGTLVVAISAGGRVAREATLLAGADLFVDKPLVFDELFRTLQIVAAAAPPDAHRRTILVLDDSPLALAITRAALETAGFTVAIAEDLVAFERQRAICDPDLILVDVQMPEAYGDDVAATLVGGKGVTVPVVLFSSLDEPELARRTALANVSAYVCKGAGIAELVRRCKQLLEVAA